MNRLRLIRFSPLYAVAALLALALALAFMLPVPVISTTVIEAPTAQPSATSYSPRQPLVQPERPVCPEDVITENLSHYPVDAVKAAQGYPYKESRFAAGPTALPYGHEQMAPDHLIAYLKSDLIYRICADQALLRMISTSLLDDYRRTVSGIYFYDTAPDPNLPLSFEQWRTNVAEYVDLINWDAASVVSMLAPVDSWTTMMVDDQNGIPQIRVTQITEPRLSHYLRVVTWSGDEQYLRLECGFQLLYRNYVDTPEMLRP